MKFFAGIAALLMTFALIGPASARMACDSYQHKETGELVKLVRDAVKLVRSKGEAAFKDFEKQGSRWNSGDRWVTVTDLSGKGVCNPRFTQAEGRDLLEFRDRNGKPVLNYMLREVTGEDGDEGWTFFYWPKPGKSTPEWRSLYVPTQPHPPARSTSSPQVTTTCLWNDVSCEIRWIRSPISSKAWARKPSPSSEAATVNTSGATLTSL